MKYFLVLILTIASSPLKAERSLTFAGIEGSLNTDISMLVLEEAYKKIGITPVLKPLPAERALHTSNSGKIDGEVFRIVNVHKRFTNLVMVPTPINVLEGIAFVKDRHIVINNGWESLSNYKIGGQVGVKFVERGTKDMNRYLVDTNEQLFHMLDRGRVDVAVAAYVNGIKTIKKLELKSIKVIQPAIQTYPLYHYLHKKNADLVPKLDKVLREMKRSGRIDQIRNEYIDHYTK